MMTGLLFLSALVMSIAPAYAAVCPDTHDAGVASSAATHDAGTAGDVWRPVHASGGVPGDGRGAIHGPACCVTGSCSMLLGWLPVPAGVLGVIAPTVLAYPDASSIRIDGVRSAPTLPPPRPIA